MDEHSSKIPIQGILYFLHAKFDGEKQIEDKLETVLP